MAQAHSDPKDTKDAKDTKDKAIGAGRGVLFIGVAKLYFIIVGFALETLLPRLLGKALYGSYGVVNVFVSNINNVIVTGTIQAVSRPTAADPSRADEVKAAGLRMQLFVALPIALLYALLAPVWAWIEHDPGKAGLLALSAGVVAFYSIYTVFVGSVNGKQQFHKQAGLDMTFATLRVGGLLAAAALGLGVWGVIEAWVAAAAVIMAIAIALVGFPRNLRVGSVAPMLRFFANVAVYLVITNLILSVDTFLLKRLVTEWFVAHGMPDPTTLADVQIAHYRVVQNLARPSYQLMIAVTFVVFPLISRSTFDKDVEKTRAYVRTTMRYSLIFGALMGTVVAAQSGSVIDLLYGNDASYATEGWLALAILALGMVAFSMFSIATNILNSAGHTSDTIAVAGLTLVLLAVGLWVGIPFGAPGREVLAIAASATSTAMVLGAAASGVYLWRRFGAFVPVATAVRVAVATAATLAAGHFWPERGKVMTLAGIAVCAALYLVVLVATGELGRRDLSALQRGRRKP
jgi:stage V sporulation protein B